MLLKPTQKLLPLVVGEEKGFCACNMSVEPTGHTEALLWACECGLLRWSSVIYGSCPCPIVTVVLAEDSKVWQIVGVTVDAPPPNPTPCLHLQGSPSCWVVMVRGHGDFQ